MTNPSPEGSPGVDYKRAADYSAPPRVAHMAHHHSATVEWNHMNYVRPVEK